MNYQHIYHAGNFADVLKHIILVQILESFKTLKKPVFFLDTHAARGRYNLKSIEATKSQEYIDGIGRLFYQSRPNLPDVVKPYIDIIKNENLNNDLVYYPGSPYLIKHYLRPQDRAALCELNDKEFFKLHALFHTYKNIKLVHGDGYEALMSFMPPREKHGLVLIDPPFEQRDEIITLENVILKSLKRWENGVFMLWYPIKEQEKFTRHLENLQQSNVPMMLFELEIPNDSVSVTGTSLRKTAVIVFNPPELLRRNQATISTLRTLLSVPVNV